MTSSSDTPSMASDKPQNYRPLLWLVAMGFFMQALDSTIVNTALPAMARSLGESPLRMQSVIIAYMLTMAIIIPVSGWLADRVGTRKIFFSAIFLFTLGSILCASSQTLPLLVASRVVQGVGGAMLLPVGRLTMLRALPRHLFLPAMSFITIPGLIGPLIGPTLGGWLVEALSWHWIFLINVPIGIIGGLATLRFMPDIRSDALMPFDSAGYFLLTSGMVALSIALDGLSELHLPHATVMLLLIFGFVSLTTYWLHAGRKGDAALFSLKLFILPSYRIGVLGNLFARIGSGSMPFLLPLLLQVCLGHTPAEAGMMMIPVALAAMLSKNFVTPLVRKFGYRQVLVANTVLVGLSIASFALMTGDEPTWLRVIHMGLFGFFNSIQFTCMNTLTLKDLDGKLASSGNGLLSMVMMLSMSLGVASAAAVLAGFTQIMGNVANTLEAFHSTFICVGLMTSAAAWIFWQLPHDEPVVTEKSDTALVE
ncbi:multidrug transporter subunit MdtD [Aquirhabdus sp.]|uniref:multidrug transporter subunit MdtD n=1 Tax=Aquirhabdus sp. TaxID=2824160 RepID=UPI00396C645E